jgi:hypothetical protein
MSQFNLIDALQMGGASATVMGLMFGVYKILTLVINHRCRSDCCGRLFSLGLAVEPTTPPTYHHTLTGEMTLSHGLLSSAPTLRLSDAEAVSVV